MSDNQHSDKPERGLADPGKKGGLGGVLFCILIVGLLSGLVVIASFAKKLATEEKQLEEQLQTCHAEEQARDVSELLEALYLPPHMVNMDGGYRRDARHIRRKMFRRQGRENVVDMRSLDNYVEHWDNYEEAPLRYRDAEKAAIGSFDWDFYQRTCKRLRSLASEIEHSRGMGLYLSQHPDLYQNHVRPLVFRLLEQLPPEDKEHAAAVLLAKEDHSPEFEDALERLYLNPELRAYRRETLRRAMERTTYADRINRLEEMRAQLEQLWSGKTPELQAEAIFSDREPGRDRYGDVLPPGALSRLGSNRFRMALPLRLAMPTDGSPSGMSKQGQQRRPFLSVMKRGDWFSARMANGLPAGPKTKSLPGRVTPSNPVSAPLFMSIITRCRTWLLQPREVNSSFSRPGSNRADIHGSSTEIPERPWSRFGLISMHKSWRSRRTTNCWQSVSGMAVCTCTRCRPGNCSLFTAVTGMRSVH